MKSLEVVLGQVLKSREWTLSVAETTTGGLICARIVAVPGSSAYFERGLIAYSSISKVTMLRVNEGVISEHGTVSEEVAIAMAEGVRVLSGTTLGLAETGIAGPLGGRRSPKPLGTAYIALATPEGTVCESFVFKGDRDAIREQIAEQALMMVVEEGQEE